MPSKTSEEMRPLAGAAPRARARAPSRVAALLVIAALIAAAWFGRVPLLRGAAELWIVSGPVGPADAVAILGGGLEVRPFAAADDYRRGLVQKVVLANVRATPSEILGVLPSHTVLNRNVLIKSGVPETAIETFGADLSNTYQEAVALRDWAMRTHALSVIVPTELFSSRRVRWMLERALAGTGTRVQVQTLDPLEYTRRDWWNNEQGIVAFQTELIKYIYYRFKY